MFQKLGGYVDNFIDGNLNPGDNEDESLSSNLDQANNVAQQLSRVRSVSLEESFNQDCYIQIKEYFLCYQQDFSSQDEVFKEFYQGNFLPRIENKKSIGNRREAYKKTDNKKGYPVLMYALAGNIAIEKFNALLTDLNAEDIQHYKSTYPLIETAATFGDLSKFTALHKRCQFKAEELKIAMLFSAYHGHVKLAEELCAKIDRMRKKKDLPRMNVETVVDSNKNTLLHLAIIGEKNVELIKSLFQKANFDKENNRGFKPIHEALFSENILLVNCLLGLYRARNILFKISDLMIFIVKNDSECFHHVVLFFLLEKALSNSNYEHKFDLLLSEAIKAQNTKLVTRLIKTIPWHDNLQRFLDLFSEQNAQYSMENQVYYAINSAFLFRKWLKEVVNPTFRT